MLRFAPRWMTCAGFAAVLLMMPGCSSSKKEVPTGKVTGKVTLDGKPVQPGSVLTFLPTSAGAEISSGLILEDGTFVAISGEFPGIPVGEYRVVVSPPRMDPKEEEELEKKNLQVVMNALVKKDRKELQKVEYPQDAIVPRKYWTEATSGLTIKVVEGDNVAEFELSSKEQQ